MPHRQGLASRRTKPHAVYMIWINILRRTLQGTHNVTLHCIIPLGRQLTQTKETPWNQQLDHTRRLGTTSCKNQTKLNCKHQVNHPYQNLTLKITIVCCRAQSKDKPCSGPTVQVTISATLQPVCMHSKAAARVALCCMSLDRWMPLGTGGCSYGEVNEHEHWDVPYHQNNKTQTPTETHRQASTHVSHLPSSISCLLSTLA
jgi:hypothetical protein